MNIERIYWTCIPSIESESCGEYDLREPRQVKISRMLSHKRWVVHSFYNGLIDYDTNATSHCREDELFNSKEEAIADFKKWKALKITQLEGEIKKIRDSIGETSISFEKAIEILENCSAIIIQDQNLAVVYPDLGEIEEPQPAWRAQYMDGEGLIYTFSFPKEGNETVEIKKGNMIWVEEDGSKVEITVLTKQNL